MYPVMLNIKGRKCTVIGGGSVALRKAKKLIACGADVTAVAKEFTSGFENIKTSQKPYDISDIENSFLVIAATDDKALNERISYDAKSKGILVSLADNAELSDFTSPASCSSGDITLAVSTGGKFPSLSKKLCEIKSKDLELYSSLLTILEKYRRIVLSENRDTKEKLLKFMVSDEMLEYAETSLDLFEQKIKEKL